MEQVESFNIWKQKGYRKEKFFFCLSYLLLFPIWRLKKHISAIDENLNILKRFKNNLFETIKLRQKQVIDFEKEHGKDIKKNLQDLCNNIGNQVINYDNMMSIELEIEGLKDIALANHHVSKIFSGFEDNLSSSELDVNSLVQGYTTFYINIISSNKRYPWKYILKCLDIKNLELIK